MCVARLSNVVVHVVVAAPRWPIAAVLLAIAGSLAVPSAGAEDPPAGTDLSARLDALQQLGYAGSWREVLSRLEALEAELAQAGARDRARHALLETRMLALSNRADAAVERVGRLLERADRLPPDLHLRALNLATNLLVLEERFEEGFGYFRQALQRARQVDVPAMRADTWNVAADFHNRIGEAATALEYAERALAEPVSDPASRQRCIAHLRRASAREALDRTASAIGDFDTAMEICESIPDRIFAGLAHLGRARTAGDAASDRHARRAAEHFGRADYADGLLQAHTMLGAAALARSDRDAAAQWLEPIDAWLQRSASRALRAGALEQRARLARLDGDLETAFTAMREAIALRHAHATKVRQMRVTMLMSDGDHANRTRDLEVLRARNEAIGLDRDARKREETALAVGAVAATLAGLLLFTLLFRTARERRRFRERSRLDSLTGLLNHTRFFELAEQAFRRARQTHTPLSLIIADVDLFKQINDHYGHLVGDQVLRRVGQQFRQAFGEEAIVGRIGGEEFGVILPDADIDEAVARIEHFRAMVNRDRPRAGQPQVTLSFGVAERSREKSLDVLYAHADQALYDAKEAGRDRVITVARIDLGAGGFVT